MKAIRMDERPAGSEACAIADGDNRIILQLAGDIKSDAVKRHSL
jgi:hypothetical protein